MALSGHLWTLYPTLRHRMLPWKAPAALPWSTSLRDPGLGEIRLTGLLREEAHGDRLLVVIHGLGGSVERHYCIKAASAAHRRGWSCLRLSLRGADRLGEDFYHAGLIADIEAAVASETVAQYSKIALLGYSLGGHVALRYAVLGDDPRVERVAAVCAPLDLDASSHALDSARFPFYRRHVLAGLNEIYAAVAARRDVPTPVGEARRIRKIRAWDAHTVVPRHGFDSVDHYYASQSVGPKLAELRIPSLLVASRNDPMVSPNTLEPSLMRVAATAAPLDVRWVEGGGHVALPRTLGLENQSRDWFDTS